MARFKRGAMDAWLGKTFGGYRLVAPLDADQLGSRYRAEADGGTGTVTVRIVAPASPDDRWFADRVVRALRSYVDLVAPGLATLLACGEADGAAYAVAVAAEGPTLRSRLGRPLVLADALALLRPVATALDALHERRLRHGDLRPERIIVGGDGRTVLTDAGLAVAIADAARLGAGGPALTAEEAVYRAPESATSYLVDTAADRYSLGVIAYEALTGRPPFTAGDAGGSAEALLRLHAERAPRPPRELNPALDAATEAALLRALAKSPYDRPATATAFLDALAAAGGVPAAANSPAPTATYGPSAAPSPPAAPITPAAPPTPSWLAQSAAPAPVTPAAQAAPVVPIAPNAPAIVLPARPSGDYAYSSPSLPVAPVASAVSPAALDARLVAERARLVGTLAAVARRRRAASVERQRPARATSARVPAARPAAPPPAPPAARATPVQRASRYEPTTERIFQVSPEEVGMAMLRSSGAILGIMLFLGLVASGLRCLVLFAVAGIFFTLYSWRNTTMREIHCGGSGFVVETGLLPWQRTAIGYDWDDVTDLLYYEAAEQTAKGQPKATFTVRTRHGTAFDQGSDHFEYDMLDMIAYFGQMTPHLPYLWVREDQPSVLPEIERVGRYRKVARPRIAAEA